jgi:hypothetical protein
VLCILLALLWQHKFVPFWDVQETPPKMQKIFRLVAIGVFAIAVAATTTAPKAVATTTSAEGGAPVPACFPGQPDCKPW